MSPADLDFLSALVRVRSGLVLAGERGFFAETRLSPLARRVGVASVSELVQRVKDGEDERLLRSVVEAMLNPETAFFRGRQTFKGLEDRILPEVAQRRGRPARVWSAGCSTGQEPYSLAMTAEDHPRLGDIDILATDLSSAAIEKAESGVYTHFEVQRGLPIRSLLRHFEPLDDGWRLRARVRDRIRWRRLNLVDAFAVAEPFDVVMCRHVLDAFDPRSRAATLQRLTAALAPDGWLVLGADEAAPEGFTLEDAPGIFRRFQAAVVAA